MKRILPLLLIVFFVQLMTAQTARERAVVLEAELLENPFAIQLKWLPDFTANSYRLHRKSLQDQDWGAPIAELGGNASAYLDSAVEEGQGYEYALFKKGFDLVNTTVCVSPGSRLRFEINDMYKIGLCCNFGIGYYRVESCGLLLAEGGDFGEQATHQLEVCTSTNACEDVVITIKPDMFPNSTSWKLYDDTSNELLASSGEVGDFIDQRPAYGYIYAGAALPPVHKRGGIYVLTEASLASGLDMELNRLYHDLRMDGWRVISNTVEQTEAVTDVKILLQRVKLLNPDVSTVLLIGQVPVPYSGNIYPDTHTEHRGAWAADTYYADLDGLWTDTSVNTTTAQFEYNHNVPGDGRFDQDTLPSDLELAIGRVDLSNMPAFSENELELTRKYLNKNHAYRNGWTAYNRRALIDDNFKVAFAAPAASGWRNFGPMFGLDQIFEQDYFSSLRAESYLWAYGCGSGSHVSSEGIGTTFEFAADSLQAVFSMLFGSQFGDWDNVNNFLRAPLASGQTLTNVWAGNPPWTFHHMAMGFPIGSAALYTQNRNNDLYLPGPQMVHTALMGDPTLCMYAFPKADSLRLSQQDGSMRLEWNPSPDTAVIGYFIYRSTDPELGYELIRPQWVSTTSYDDNSLTQQGVYHYMVRAVKLEKTGSGSFYNLSLGIRGEEPFTPVVATSNLATQSMGIYPNPAKDQLAITFAKPIHELAKVELLLVNGQTVFKHKEEVIGSRLLLNLPVLKEGIYLLRIQLREATYLEKVVIHSIRN